LSLAFWLGSAYNTPYRTNDHVTVTIYMDKMISIKARSKGNIQLKMAQLKILQKDANHNFLFFFFFLDNYEVWNF
jgi:hypothetical protein